MCNIQKSAQIIARVYLVKGSQREHTHAFILVCLTYFVHILFERFIYVTLCGVWFVCFQASVALYDYTPTCISNPLYGWKFRLFLVWGYCKYCCYQYFFAYLLVHMCCSVYFVLFILRSENLGVLTYSAFVNSFKKIS